ncbi:holin [Aeromonas diversa]|uniref:holin n=1 Tax=Aeromonas diversa TaxID=502790 RepID=UPI003462AED7
MKKMFSLLVLCLVATGVVGLLTLSAATLAPSMEVRVLSVIGALLAGYLMMQPIVNRLASRLA